MDVQVLKREEVYPDQFVILEMGINVEVLELIFFLDSFYEKKLVAQIKTILLLKSFVNFIRTVGNI
jgi:hypothetical protein